MLAAAVVIGGSTAQAQFPPESLENLSVLPSDMEVREVIDIMRGFAQALGVRCQHCHVGRAGQPLSEFDFVSDEKPAKETARDMLRMVWAVNQEHVAGLANRGDPPLEVQCAMCHRGQARPITTQQALISAINDGGPEAGIEQYRRLRARYYGSATYDFSEMVLIDVATQLAEDDKAEAALAFATLNLEFFGESSTSHTAVGQLYQQLGQRDQAIEHLEKALELNPRNRFAQQLLERIRGGD
jgi:tetratricopeptide (TPR) repeat protein